MKGKTSPTLLPKGWILSGSAPENYVVSIDKTVYYQKGSSAELLSTIDSDKFGTLMQTFSPNSTFLGKRFKLSAWVKSEQVTSWAGLWMRIDGKFDETLGFDNMQDRPIKGTVDWAHYEIVLDIPVTAEHVAFGILLVGSGTVWIDKVVLEPVSTDVPVTGKTPLVGAGPVNLDFEE